MVLICLLLCGARGGEEPVSSQCDRLPREGMRGFQLSLRHSFMKIDKVAQTSTSNRNVVNDLMKQRCGELRYTW